MCAVTDYFFKEMNTVSLFENRRYFNQNRVLFFTIDHFNDGNASWFTMIQTDFQPSKNAHINHKCGHTPQITQRELVNEK